MRVVEYECSSENCTNRMTGGKRGRPRLWCDDCRPKVHRKTPKEGTCETCGTIFIRKQGRPSKYCPDHRSQKGKKPVRAHGMISLEKAKENESAIDN